jgi:hypothetical protein
LPSPTVRRITRDVPLDTLFKTAKLGGIINQEEVANSVADCERLLFLVGGRMDSAEAVER